MKIFIVDFDFFTTVGGGQVFYRRVVERHPNVRFFYPSRGHDLGKKSSLPLNAEPFAFDEQPPTWPELAKLASQYPEGHYVGSLWNVARPLQGMRFDAVDIPSFFPCGQ